MKDFTRDPVALKALEDDPLTKDETQPAATVAALVRADERLHDSFGQITLPVLILHGTEDHATVCKGSEFFFEHAGSADKTLKLYEGHYHDLLNDLGKEEVLADVVGWIEARLPARAPDAVRPRGPARPAPAGRGRSAACTNGSASPSARQARKAGSARCAAT